MVQTSPAIVVALYNRVKPAERLLDSLAAAYYPADAHIRLVISIDNEHDQNLDVKKFADDFHWKFGPKEVIYHEKNLGLRDHFNFCGGLTERYGSVVFLEDDLFVSKWYYDYTLQALEFYKNDPDVAGISLFNYNRIEQKVNPWPFTAIDDGYDNYFLQQASWGQIWTWQMWKPFLEWFKSNGRPEIINSFDQVPGNVKRWPNSSWKKNYITYMILHNKYYVFPRIALACNFDDPGTHRKLETVYYQSPLLINQKKFNFGKLSQSQSIYDSFFEILPDILKKHNSDLKAFDFQVNLYGNKEKTALKSKFVLSRVPGKHNARCYNMVMKPHELNVIFDRQGNQIFLSETQSLYDSNPGDRFVNDIVYYYRNNFHFTEFLSLIRRKWKEKFRQ